MFALVIGHLRRLHGRADGAVSAARTRARARHSGLTRLARRTGSHKVNPAHIKAFMKRKARLQLVGLTVLTMCAAAESPTGLVKTEFIYETAPFPECHASTLAET